jgi:hypothetical protein
MSLAKGFHQLRYQERLVVSFKLIIVQVERTFFLSILYCRNLSELCAEELLHEKVELKALSVSIGNSTEILLTCCSP